MKTQKLKKIKKQTSVSKGILLEGVNITKKFRRGEEIIEVIKDLNIIIRESDFISILTPNTIGKDSILNCLCGIEDIDKGEIYFNEENIDNMSDSEKRLIRAKNFGFIFSEITLIPGLTLKENIEISFINLKEKPDSKNIENLLQEFELKGKADLFPESLTIFESQKTALCRAIVHNPKIIFAHEPTSMLSAKDAEEFLNLLTRINKEKNIAVVILTDNINIAARNGKLLRFENGRLS